MNSDAQEAAMGLLSLSPSNIPQPTALVPQKRKVPPAQSPHCHPNPPVTGDHTSHPSKRRSTQRIVVQYQPPRESEREKEPELPPPPPPTVPPVKEQEGDEDISTDPIRCICESTFDDGFSIACDDCSRWCHAACFGIVDNGDVPEEWRCWVCDPRPVDREGAVRTQRERRLAQKQLADAEKERERQKRRISSPGADRKQRRTSATNPDGHTHKRKRRVSILAASAPIPPTTANQDDDVDVVVDIDEPWTHSYVPIAQDIVSAQSTRDKLRKQAQNWRGITAIEPWSPPPISVQQLPPEDTSVRPPSYAVHTTQPITSEQLITPFPSTITPSATYLSDPLNSYAHLGMPKPFVHLIGPPLDLALDARITGDKARFVRSGCRPNAVLRPFLCRSSSSQQTAGTPDETLAFAVFASRDLKADEEVVLGWEWDDGNAVHSLPALIQTPHMFPKAHYSHLRAQMTNILHLLTSTFTTCACGSRARDCALAQMERFVNDGQHAPPSAPDGPEFSEDVDLGPLIGKERGFRTRPRNKGSSGMGGVEMWDSPQEGPGRSGDIDGDAEMDDRTQNPVLSGDETEDEEIPPRSRPHRQECRDDITAWDRSRTHTQKQLRPPDPEPVAPSILTDNMKKAVRRRLERDGPRRVSWDDEVLGAGVRGIDPPTLDELPSMEEKEEKMPPKMRKRWIHREVEVLKETYGEETDADTRWETEAKVGAGADGAHEDSPVLGETDVQMRDLHVDETMDTDTIVVEAPSSPAEPRLPLDSSDAPTPPVPPSTSPSESFARLSLVSPVVSSTHPPPSHPPSFSLQQSWDPSPPPQPELQDQDSPMQDPHSDHDDDDRPTPLRTPPRAGGEACPASSPTSPDIPPAASPPTPSTSTPSVELPTPAIRVELEEDERSPQVLQSEWSPLRRAALPQDDGIKKGEVMEVNPQRSLSPLPATTLRLSLPSSTSSTDYYPELRSDEEILPLPPALPVPKNKTSSLTTVRTDHAPRPALPTSPIIISTIPLPPRASSLSVAASVSPTSTPTLPLRDPTPPLPSTEESVPSTSAPPPPKVKISLKDFAARRRKQKEEEGKAGAQSAGTSVEASPVVRAVGLAAEPGAGMGMLVSASPSPGAGDALVGAEVPSNDGRREVTGSAKVGNGRSGFGTAVAEGKGDKSTETGKEGTGEVDALEIDDMQIPYNDQPLLPCTPLPSPSPTIPLSTTMSQRETPMTLQSKTELFEQPLSLPRTLNPPSRPTFHSPANGTSHTTPLSHPPYPSTSHQMTHEEGEIPSPGRDTPPTKHLSTTLSSRNSYVPRSHTPPKQPRSFAMSPASVSTSTPSSFSRLPPSGPRALRMNATFQQSPSGSRSLSSRPPTGPSLSSSASMDTDGRRAPDYDRDRRQSLPPSVPRGPSADRERLESDRDRPLGRPRISRHGVGGWAR